MSADWIQGVFECGGLCNFDYYEKPFAVVYSKTKETLDKLTTLLDGPCPVGVPFTQEYHLTLTEGRLTRLISLLPESRWDVQIVSKWLETTGTDIKSILFRKALVTS